MSTHTPHASHPASRGRWALALVACLALAAGASGANASLAPSGALGKRNPKPKVTILETAPSAPAAGQTYTIALAAVAGQEHRHMVDFGCHARVEKKVVLPLDESGDGYLAHCSWNLPANAGGKTMYGLVAVELDDGVTYYLGWEAPIS
jgi:hypothetical protein